MVGHWLVLWQEFPRLHRHNGPHTLTGSVPMTGLMVQDRASLRTRIVEVSACLGRVGERQRMLAALTGGLAE